MTTSSAKLYGKDAGEYDDLDVDQLLAQLSPEEISILAKEVDPDVSTLNLWKYTSRPTGSFYYLFKLELSPLNPKFLY